MKDMYIVPLILSIFGTYLIVKAFQHFILGNGLRKRGVTSHAVLHCLDDESIGLDRYYVTFTLEDGQEVKKRLRHVPRADFANGEEVVVWYDAKHPKRVVLYGSSLTLYMSLGCFLVGLSMFSYNLSAYMLMNLL